MFAVAAQTCLHSAPALAFLEGLGAGEMMLVALIGLLLFGGKGLPDMARTLGKVMREFKKATQGVEDEMRRVMDEDSATPPRPKPKPRPLPAPAAPAALPAATPSPAPSESAPAPDMPPPPPAAPSTPPPDQSGA